MGSALGRRSSLAKLAYALLWLVLAFVVLLNKYGVLTPDIKPEIYLAPGRAAASLVSSWFEGQQLGLPNFNVGLAPVAAFVAFLQGLGLSPALSMRVLRLLLLTIAGWGAARLYRHVAGTRSTDAGRLLASVLYVANPYVVVAGDTLAIVLPLAFLPWQILFLLRALQDRRSWRWPAAFALTFVAMSGMNVAVVPLIQLVYVLPVLWYVVRRYRPPLRHLVAGLCRCACLTLLVSVYWLVPALSARGVGDNVVNNSETFRGIAGPSSFAEVLRGLGLWVMYGGGPSGPWQPGFTPYLTNPFVMIASFTLPVLFAGSMLLTRGRVRRLALGLVALSALLMVGLHPPDHPSPVGLAMRYVFEHVTAAAAFRTTNKAGSVLVLGMALLVAVGGASLVRRLPRQRLVASSAALAVLLVGSAWPAFSGGLYSDQLTVPAYWKQAAAAVDTGSPQQRVWLVPGEVRSDYRWSLERVDDIDKSLLTRPSVVQFTIPAASADSANFMTAIDTLLQEGSLPPGSVSAAARYLGASDVLVRNDLVWEETNGARPATIQQEVTPDAGLFPAGVFGQPGENTTSAVVPPASPFEAALPPVERYQVTGSRDMLRVEPLAGSVLVDGDGWSVAPLVAAGLLGGDPAFRYLGETDPAQLAQALDAGTRLVITDTNRRRTSLTDRLANSQGPLLEARQPTGASRVLFADPSSQTVLKVEGGTVTATSVGSVFGTLPYAAAENAFDGDQRTAWLFGDFGNAVGQSVHLHLTAAKSISHVHLVMLPVGPLAISRVRLQVGSVSRTVGVPASGIVDVSLPQTEATDVSMTVLATSGTGINLVGVNEIGITGVQVQRVAQLPTRLTELAGQLDPSATAALGRTPIDVVLSRVLGTSTAGDDEETGLDRDFTLPQARTFRLYGLIRPDAAATDDRIDQLLGYTGDVVATSSSRLFGNPDVRASFAVDGNPFTGWSPAGPVVGQWLDLSGTRQRVDHIDVVQPAGPSSTSSYVSKVRVFLDGRLVATAGLHPGTTRIPIVPQDASELRLVIAGQSGTGFIQLSEVRFGDAHISKKSGAALNSCVTVAELDGRPVSMRPVQPLGSMGPTLFAGCGAPITLAAGPHQLRSVHSWMPDELVLRDALGENASNHPTVLTDVTTQRLSATHWRVTANLPAGPQVVVLGQNYDVGWQATVDGRPAGPTVVADGYSAAWILTDPGRHTIDIEYSPQQGSTIALGFSAAGLALCVGLVLWRGGPVEPVARRPRRHRPPRARPTGRLVSLVRWAALVGCAWLAGGVHLVPVAVVLAAWHLWRAPEPRRLIRLGVLLLVLCPLAFMVGNLPRWGQISPDLVLQNEAPHWLAASALLLLLVGVWRDDAQPSIVRRKDEPSAGAAGR